MTPERPRGREGSPPRRAMSRDQLKKEEQTPMAVKAKPDGYHTITPYLIVRGGAAAIDYYKTAFGAEELVRMPGPGGTIGHAEIRIGDSVVMLADESPAAGHRSPQSLNGSPVGLAVYVEDVDSRFNRAIAAGG